MLLEQMNVTRRTNSLAYSYRIDTNANLRLHTPYASRGTNKSEVWTLWTYFCPPMWHFNFLVTVGMSATFQWLQAALLLLCTDISINKILRNLWVCFTKENSYFLPLNRFIGNQCCGWNESLAYDSCPWWFVQIEEVASKALQMFFVHKIIWEKVSNTRE